MYGIASAFLPHTYYSSEGECMSLLASFSDSSSSLAKHSSSPSHLLFLRSFVLMQSSHLICCSVRVLICFPLPDSGYIAFRTQLTGAAEAFE